MDEQQNHISEAELAITYTVKELLARIDERVVIMDTKLDAKASIEHVDHVEKKIHERVDGIDERVGLLELGRAKVLGGVAMLTFLAGGGGMALGQFLGRA